jgi:heme exporter protein B
MNVFSMIIKREVTLQFRSLRGVVNASLFFLMVLLLFPLSFPADPVFLKRVLPGLVWIAALFAFFLSADGLFQHEDEDGVLEQWLLSSYLMHHRIRIKLWVHWVLHMLPLLVLCPLVALVFNLNASELGLLMLSLVCGTPTLVGLSAFSASFGLGLVRPGLFTALIVLPLTLPVMVFGGGVLSSMMQGLPVGGHVALLLAVSIMALWLMPYAIAAVIRVGVADASR